MTKQELHDIFSTSENIDVDRLPPIYKTLIEKYLALKLPNVSHEAFVFIITACISEIACFYRVKSASDVGSYSLNFYGLMFAGSGNYKDLTYNMISENLFKLAHEQGEKAIKKYNHDLEKEDRIPKDVLIVDNSTAQALNKARGLFEKSGLNTVTVVISEFADFIENSDKFREQFMSLLTKIWHAGNSKADMAITREDSLKSIRNVPVTVLAYSATTGMANNENFQKLKERFERGWTRRFFILNINDKIEQKYEKYHERKDTKRWSSMADSNLEDLQKELSRIVSKIAPNSIREPKTYIPCTDKVLDWHHAYDVYCKKRAEKLNDLSMIKEIQERPLKMLKIAGLFAICNKESEVSFESVKQATYFVEYFSQFFEDFFEFREESRSDQIYQLLSKKVGDYLSKKEIRDGIGASNYSSFKSYEFDSAMSEVEELAGEKGYKLESAKVGSRGMKYRLVNDELKREEKQLEEEIDELLG